MEENELVSIHGLMLLWIKLNIINQLDMKITPVIDPTNYQHVTELTTS